MVASLVMVIIGMVGIPTYAATISLSPPNELGVTIVTLYGEIRPNDNVLFSNAITGLSDALIILESPGGSLGAGLEIGKKIRMRNFSTLVRSDRTCASACSLAWLGGSKRYMQERARIGFHAAYVIREGVAYEKGDGNALMGAYLTNLGLGERAVAYITMAAPDDMTYLDINAAQALGIDVELLPGQRQTAVAGNQSEQPASSIQHPAPTLAPASGSRESGSHESRSQAGWEIQMRKKPN